MSGSALEVFNDFVLSTGPAIFSGPDSMINEATKNSYMLARLLSGDMSARIQGGSKIKDQIYFDEASTFQNYLPNESFSWENPQVMDEWEVQWRFSTAHMSWTDQEVGLQSGEMSQPARFQKYKTLKRTKEMNLWTSMMNGLEEQLWASPDAAEMEVSTGRKPYSIAALVNEHAIIDPLWALTSSTVQGINPTTQAKWRNQKEDYAAFGVQGAPKHVFEAFDRMWKKLRFDNLPVYKDYNERPTNPGVIACSLEGSAKFENALRVNQDWFRPAPQDPAYSHPMYRNVPVIYIAELGTAALYHAPDGTAYVDENTGDAADLNGGTGSASDSTGFIGPRYYFLNGEYLKKTIHRDRYFHKKTPFSPSAQPYNTVCPVDIWHNNHARSLQRLGIVCPSTNQ